MIARISSGKIPSGAVYYNEQKVKTGAATRLAIRNFDGLDVPLHQLTAGVVAGQLTQRAALNERIRKPTFHVSLALAKGEKLAAEDLIAIADEYMQGMGYSRQPYAIYQHHDTEHPHIHVVSVRVNEGGKNISDQFERKKSNELRQQLEKDFGLQVAEQAALKPVSNQIRPVEYGRGDLKTAISEVIQCILRDYTFSSFAQFNQLLNDYNVLATEVVGDGRRGVTYSALNEQRQPVGTLFKASSLPFRPTASVVERRIQAGKKIKGDRIGALRRTMEGIRRQSGDWSSYQQQLADAGIRLLPHLGEGGTLYGLSYLATRQHTLYTGTELGKAFTAGTLKTAFEGRYPLAENLPNVASSRRASAGGDGAQTQQPILPSLPDLPANNSNNILSSSSHWQALVRAIGAGEDGQAGEDDLQRMLKKSRKRRIT